MSRLLFVVLTCVSLVGCETRPAFQEPPADSYAVTTMQMKIGESAAAVQVAHVTPDFFKTTGVQPLLGRLILDGEHGASPRRELADSRIQQVVVLSSELWAARFASSPSVIGRSVELDGHSVTIVGILPTTFRLPHGAQVWTTR